MVAKEYCCYTRPYSRIEGFQLAHTLYYSASVEEEGVVLAVRQQQGEECVTEQVICPVGDFGRLTGVQTCALPISTGWMYWTTQGRCTGPARLQMGSRRAESLHDLWHLLVLRGQTWYIILN